MAAPAEPRTPNLHRAKRIAPRECGWKHGDSGSSAREKRCSTKQKQNRLDSDRPSHGRRLHSLTDNSTTADCKAVRSGLASEPACPAWRSQILINRALYCQRLSTHPQNADECATRPEACPCAPPLREFVLPERGTNRLVHPGSCCGRIVGEVGIEGLRSNLRFIGDGAA